MRVEKHGMNSAEALIIKNSAIESSINAITLANTEGNLTYVNSSFLKLWGYDSESEVIGRPVSNFWHIDDINIQVLEVLHDKGNWIGELSAKRKDGSSFDVQMSASIVTDDSGNPTCMMGSFVDITNHKHMHELIINAKEEWEETFNIINDAITIHDKVRAMYLIQ